MSDLLPANVTPGERALSLAVERAAGMPAPVRDVWNPDTCPESLLPWLAWAYSVDEWDSTWTEHQKRDTIKTSIEVHRYKGTIGAVRDALAALGFDAQVQEWFNQIPEAPPYTFDILLTADQIGAPTSAIQRLLAVLERSKNLRSHLGQIKLIVKTAAGPTVGVVGSVGSEVTVGYVPPMLLINEHVICVNGPIAVNETTFAI